MSAAMLLVMLAGEPGVVHARVQTQQTEQPAVTAGPQRIEMTVLGLSCPFCAYGLEKKLRKVEGITSLDIDFKTGKVRMEVRDGSTVSDERLNQLVKDAGFELKEITRSSLTGSTHTGEESAR